jgi:ArsR family transcriptional regulator, lead/cadmium/zinc/bismuth-responsive transcriptional repressor
MNDRSSFFKLERFLKGAANHRRLEVLFLLAKNPELSVEDIAEKLNVNFNTISDHIRKMAQAGLVMKRSDGQSVRHALTDKGRDILVFCKTLV